MSHQDKTPSAQSASHAPSVTEWIADLKAGDQRAAQKILDRYMGRLLNFASRRLGELRRAFADEEDVVLIAFNSFLKKVNDGGFSRLDDRHDLWQILLMLTDRKAIDLIRHQTAQSRGSGKQSGESVFETVDSEGSTGISGIRDRGPSPTYAAVFAEELADRLSHLNPDLQQIAIDRMHGLTNPEIAEKRGVKLRTVERRLKEIRDLWRNSAEP